MSQAIATGIDLGTTNSAMARIDEAGRSAMILNAEGEVITPSVVLFADSEVVVGKPARSAITAQPDRVAQWVKRDMGAPFYSHPIRGQYLPPEVIQACILRKLKNDLLRAVGPEARTVITVPAYFDEMRRKATADAGEMAGLAVLDIVNEPTAAALAFGEVLGFLTPAAAPLGEMNVLVYDLGGGTFDATLLHLAPGKVQTIGTDGDVQLGGHDWDQRLVDYAAESFQAVHGIDPRQDPATLNRLFQDAMEAKHTLSARSRATIHVDYRGKSAEAQVLRAQFEELTADLVERSAYTTRQLLSASELEWKQVQRVLLVGGSTRMPMVPRMLKALTGMDPDRLVNPDEAVARGAALYAAYLLGKRGLSQLPSGETGTVPFGRASFSVTDVNAHSLGVEGIDTDTLRKKNVILIPRNTPLPVTHTEHFATRSDGQRSIVVRVLEGESSLPGECQPIGRTVVRDLPAGLPKGWPVDITFEYGANGRLAVRALVPGTEHQTVLELEREVGVTGEGMARWKLPVSAAAGFEAFCSVVRDTTPPGSGAGGPGSGGRRRPDSEVIADWALAGERGESPAAAAPILGDLGGPVERRPGNPWSPAPPPLARGVPHAGAKPGGVSTAPPGHSRQPATACHHQPAAAGDTSDPQAAKMEPFSFGAPPSTKRRPQPWYTHWLARLIGHVVAAGMGLTAAYWVLHHFRPDLLRW